MTKLAPKRERRAFVVRAVKLLLNLGAEQGSDDRFHLDTVAGRLTLHVTENERSGLDTDFTRFDDPETAYRFVPCNQYSGKWNHHYFDGWTAETALANFTQEIQRVLAKSAK